MQTNKKKILVVQGLHDVGLKMLKERSDIEYKILMSDNEDEICEAASDVHAITVRTANITEKIINNAKKVE